MIKSFDIEIIRFKPVAGTRKINCHFKANGHPGNIVVLMGKSAGKSYEYITDPYVAFGEKEYRILTKQILNELDEIASKSPLGSHLYWICLSELNTVDVIAVYKYGVYVVVDCNNPKNFMYLFGADFSRTRKPKMRNLLLVSEDSEKVYEDCVKLHDLIIKKMSDHHMEVLTPDTYFILNWIKIYYKCIKGNNIPDYPSKIIGVCKLYKEGMIKRAINAFWKSFKDTNVKLVEIRYIEYGPLPGDDEFNNCIESFHDKTRRFINNG